MLRRYTGLTPSNVRQDAKYSVISGYKRDGFSGDSGDRIRLIFPVSPRSHYPLTTSQHPRLANMVNEVKRELSDRSRGIFYINEFCDVLVPGGSGRSYWAGYYKENLEFDYEGKVISPKAPAGLKPGDAWDGPRPGIRYILCSGARNIRYQSDIVGEKVRVLLSDHVGRDAAARLAGRLGGIIGENGGRFYINERGEMFHRAREGDGFAFVYLGNLDDDLWFLPPDGYERP
jgi:hypothetical protein